MWGESKIGRLGPIGEDFLSGLQGVAVSSSLSWWLHLEAAPSRSALLPSLFLSLSPQTEVSRSETVHGGLELHRTVGWAHIYIRA